MTGNELRSEFLRFFAERGHLVMPSFPLVLPEDPSTLFVVAGMQPFAPVFRGEAPAPAARVATSQKILREGDLEVVGAIGRYHTFYEMLGNFSFGDYFKREAVQYAWDFCTEVMNLPADRLYFSVYVEDHETAGYWQEITGCSPDRIVPLGKEDNWWPKAAWNGPCGPCSEIYLDRGEEWGCGRPECKPGCDCDRFLEFWNLVFQMYLQEADGTIVGELPQFGIDTGMGLERAASLVMNVPSNYETDLVVPVIERLVEVLREDEGIDIYYTACRPRPRKSDGEPGPPIESDDVVSARLRGIADHIRAASFLIADGVLPSGDGRGSVLRRLIRRSFGHGWRLGVQQPFLYKCVPGVVHALGNAYPEIGERSVYIENTIRGEEEQFRSTVEAGMALLHRTLEREREAGSTTLNSETAFTLATTHGFPAELTGDVSSQYGFTVDWEAYGRLMEEHRTKSRDPLKVAAGQFTPGLSAIRTQSGPTRFTGYQETFGRATVCGIVAEGADRDLLQAGESGTIVLDSTPFYGESGGQVGDAGTLLWTGGAARVLNTTKLNDLWLHQVEVTVGELKPGQEVEASVDTDRRARIMRNHTATHLLHAALHEVIGNHATQAGSLVAPDRLRFDFTHTEPMSSEQIREVESRVQEWIDEDLPVNTEEKGLDEARALGAMALFGEKYGDRVRMVEVGDGAFSRELCGGTHVPSTGVVGLFHITSEAGVGSGLRRIEAVTGPGAVSFFRERDQALGAAAGQLRCEPEDVPDRVARLQQQLKEAQKQRDDLLLGKGGAPAADEAVMVDGAAIIVRRQDGLDADTLGKLVDKACSQRKAAAAVVASLRDGRVVFVSKVTPELVRRGVHAGNLVKALATRTGGGGGGRPDFAQAGGRNADAIDAALAEVPALVSQMIAEAAG